MNCAYHLSVGDLMNVPGAIEVIEEASETVEAEILAVFEDAVRLWDVARAREGARLGDAMRPEQEAIAAAVESIEGRWGAAVAEHQARLRQRVAELVSSTGGALDEKRLELEIALLAEKSDVREELVRLRSHLVTVRQLLDPQARDRGPQGPELGFLLQELLREANTVASKVQDVPIVQAVIGVKKSIDRIREMAANVV